MRSPKRRILCTEDHPDSRDLIIYVLEASGYEVVCTEAAIDALTTARREHFDLFLVDNWLPDLTGPELTRQLREFNTTTPILFYSAAAFESDKESAFKAGAQGYLVKPAGIVQLVEEVDRLIAEAGI